MPPDPSSGGLAWPVSSTAFHHPRSRWRCSRYSSPSEGLDAALALPKNSVGSNQIRKGAVKNAKIAANAVTGAKVRPGSLTGSDFRAGTLLQGPRGERGERGERGPQGNPGTNGSPAFGGVLGRGVNMPAGPSFLAPSGQLAANANENNVSSFTPNATMTASDLAVTLTVAPGLADTRTFTLRVGNANSALTCTVPGGNTGCTKQSKCDDPRRFADLDWLHQHWRPDADRRAIRVARDQLSKRGRLAMLEIRPHRPTAKPLTRHHPSLSAAQDVDDRTRAALFGSRWATR